VKLGDLIEGGTECRLPRRFAQPLAREPRLVERFGPDTLE
jgi:hypothetical protein